VHPGYRLHKHIGQALQKRSSAIHTALDRYNVAAATLTPPRLSLKWDEVVEYAFLSNFDLLRDACQEFKVTCGQLLQDIMQWTVTQNPSGPQD